MTEGVGLRLIAQDVDDLKVVSAAIQDGVLKAENIKYDRRARRFSLEINRFAWEHADGKRGPKTRVRSLLAFDSVLEVKSRAVNKSDPDMVMSLMNVDFKPDDEPPGGVIAILFSGDGELALTVEAIDVTLLDSDYEWNTRHTPDHEKKRR